MAAVRPTAAARRLIGRALQLLVGVLLGELARLHVRVLVARVAGGRRERRRLAVARLRLAQQRVDDGGVLGDRRPAMNSSDGVSRVVMFLPTSVRSIPVADFSAAAVSARSSSVP